MLEIELISTFGNLFVSAQWLPAQEALQAAHFIASSNPQVVCVRIQTDRQRWRRR